MSETARIDVDADEFESAYVFVNMGSRDEHAAYVSIDTGKIHCTSELGDLEPEEDLPEDLEESDRYIALPDKNELDLGRNLALRFAAQEMADDYDRVASYFRRRGAYARFKDLLEIRGTLERWYEFENQATDAALREWCEENGIRLVKRPRVTNPG